MSVPAERSQLLDGIRDEINRVFIGRPEVVDLALTAVLASRTSA